MSLLNLILAKSRPYVPFTVSIGGEEFNLYARKASVADSESLGSVWDEKYTEARASFDDSDEKKAPIFAQILRLGKDALIKYILQADKNDIRSEALQLHSGKDVDDPAVLHEIEDITSIKEQGLQTLDLEDLRNEAMQRRVHFYALAQANEEVSRAMAVMMVYTLEGEEYKKLFSSVSDAADMTLADLSEMVSKASEALEAKTAVSPLESPKSDEESPAVPSENSTP